MKTIKTLIKAQKHKLDMIRRNLVSLESQKAQLEEVSDKLEAELASEIALSEQRADISSFFGDYIKRVRERQAELQKEVREVEVHIQMTREAVRHEYSEQLKFEQILEIKQLEQKKAADRKEGIELDDIAANQHARKEEVE